MNIDEGVILILANRNDPSVCRIEYLAANEPDRLIDMDTLQGWHIASTLPTQNVLAVHANVVNRLRREGKSSLFPARAYACARRRGQANE